MFHLITGGSGSGKSEYAESEVERLAHLTEREEKYYIATMFPYGEETLQKIRRHQQMRTGKGFVTLECYTDLDRLVASDPFLGEPSKRPTVLLECMSNLLANECYMESGAKARELDPVAEIEKGMEALLECCEHVVVVTNEVFSDIPVESREMKIYLEYLGRINQWVAKRADQVTEVIYGIPLKKKRETVENFSTESANGGKRNSHEQEMEKCAQNFKMEQSGKNGGKGMRMYIGGAYQGKLSYAKQQNPDIKWRDGASCTLEELLEAQGVYRFQEFIRKHMEIEDLAEQLIQENPRSVIVTDEIGYGLVPVEEEARNFRERTGRICTKLAAHCERVERIVCGISTRIR